MLCCLFFVGMVGVDVYQLVVFIFEFVEWYVLVVVVLVFVDFCGDDSVGFGEVWEQGEFFGKIWFFECYCLCCVIEV